MNYARVGSGWHVSMMGGHTNYTSGNGNAVFLVIRYGGAARLTIPVAMGMRFFWLSDTEERQEVEDGGAIEW